MQWITDRTQEDVRLGTEKGTYGAKDLNRVEQAVRELCVLARKLDVFCALQTKTDWELPCLFSADQWPTEGQMQRYLSNVHRLCEALALKVPLPQTMQKLNWQGANQIEQALETAYARVESILRNFQFSGELFAGEENRI